MLLRYPDGLEEDNRRSWYLPSSSSLSSLLWGPSRVSRMIRGRSDGCPLPPPPEDRPVLHQRRRSLALWDFGTEESWLPPWLDSKTSSSSNLVDGKIGFRFKTSIFWGDSFFFVPNLFWFADPCRIIGQYHSRQFNYKERMNFNYRQHPGNFSGNPTQHPGLEPQVYSHNKSPV